MMGFNFGRDGGQSSRGYASPGSSGDFTARSAVAVETENPLAFAIIVEAVAGFDLQVRRIFPERVELDLLVLFASEGEGFTALDATELCLEFSQLPLLRDCGGGNQKAECDGEHDTEEAVDTLNESRGAFDLGEFFRCDPFPGHERRHLEPKRGQCQEKRRIGVVLRHCKAGRSGYGSPPGA